MRSSPSVFGIALGAVALTFISACKPPADESAAVPGSVASTPVPASQPGLAQPGIAAPTTAVLDTADQQVCYGLGYTMGANIAAQPGITADMPALIAGLEDGLKQAELRINPAALQIAFETIQKRHEAKIAEAAAAALADANAFLASNAKRPGVTVTRSGLHYEVIKPSADPEGAHPLATDTVEVHYHGTLPDGTVFDSSIERGEPATFPVGGVIPGWTEALQLMSVGDRWKLYLPPGLAYGPRGAGSIPANAALIFEVELLSIKTPDTQEP